ncbi:MAG TPA: hypothetical protein PKV12_02840 [Candidatus Syntrophosphaera sp.]|jgi:hypothetical protein|nr:hypothetical protein [Candidatus Syntrophosphaera sp.]HQM79627.1 hypothetical protein [Candidatus Syntrophosphaera sp.]HRD00931.1 hypothetical protein [Candidatus Syntrophosphaera thermopropionivorans]
MKVKFKYGIRTYSGKLDELVFSSYRKGKLCIAREFVYPRITPHNNEIGSVGKNLGLLWAEGSDEFKSQLAMYAKLNATENVPANQWAPNAYALWVQLMHKWAADHDDVDLKTLTVEDFAVTGITVSTVKNCVLNGYLKPVTGYDTMTAAF